MEKMGSSIAEELGKALDEAETIDAAPIDTAPVDVAPVEAAPVDTGRDEKGRFAPKEEKPAEAAPIDPAAPVTAGASAAIDPQAPADTRAVSAPPATWSASAKAIYATLPEVARKEIAKREADYSRGIQQHAEAAKGYQSLMRAFQPYEAMIRSENGTPEGAIRDLLNTAYLLRTQSPQQKAQIVMQIAQKFGADLSPYLSQQAEQPAGQVQDMSQMQQMVNQLVSPHLQKIQQWEAQQQQARMTAEQQMEQDVSSQIETFQNATNEDGTPKHLYYENVRPLMSAYFANGQAKTLEQAYDMACWANPEVRAALQADMERSAEAKRLDEAKRKAAGARSASFNVSGQGGVGISGATQSSLRDELSAQLDAAMGGARV